VEAAVVAGIARGVGFHEGRIEFCGAALSDIRIEKNLIGHSAFRYDADGLDMELIHII
jgi:hypothetical protein